MAEKRDGKEKPKSTIEQRLAKIDQRLKRIDQRLNTMEKATNRQFDFNVELTIAAIIGSTVLAVTSLKVAFIVLAVLLCIILCINVVLALYKARQNSTNDE